MFKRQKSYELNLTNPCSEEWSKMSPTEKGRHCEVCEKNVIDLTHLSDTSLFQFLEKNDEQFCGRVLNSQLNREIVVPNQNGNLLGRAAAVLAMIGGTLSAFGQESERDSTYSILVENSIDYKDTALIKKLDSNYRDVTISGTVRNEENEVVPFANVIVLENEETVAGAHTDFDGNFNLVLNTNKDSLKIRVTEISHITFENQYPIGSMDNLILSVQVKKDYGKILMQVGGIGSKKAHRASKRSVVKLNRKKKNKENHENSK